MTTGRINQVAVTPTAAWPADREHNAGSGNLTRTPDPCSPRQRLLQTIALPVNSTSASTKVFAPRKAAHGMARAEAYHPITRSYKS